MLIPLICKNCGGKLEVEKSQVFESGDTVVVLSDQTFSCPHCGTKYLPGEKIKHALGKWLFQLVAMPMVQILLLEMEML